MKSTSAIVPAFAEGRGHLRASGVRWGRTSVLVTAALVVAIACAMLAWTAGSAQAFTQVQVDSGFGTLSGTPAIGGTFNQPGGIAVRQSTGQIYVMDRTNRRIQRFSPTGVFQRAWGWDVVQTGGSGDDNVAPANQFEICTVAAECQVGSTGSGAGQFGASNSVQGIALDPATGAVYVTDAVNSRIQKFDADGNFLRMWGRDVVSTGSGNADERQAVTVNATAGTFTLTFSAQTTAPIAFDAPAATVQTALEALSNLDPGDVVVTGGPGGAGGATPYVVQFGGARANVDVAAMTASAAGLTGTVTVTTPLAGGVGFEICVPGSGDVCKTGTAGALAGEMASQAATAVATDTAGNVYIGERTPNRRIQKYDSDGNPLRAWSWDAVSAGPGNDTVAPLNEFEICVLANGDVCKAGTTGTGLGQFSSATGVFYLAIDSTNRVYVSDTSGNRVQRFQSDGTSPESFGAAELTGASVTTGPQQIAVDRSDDHVYVVKLDPDAAEVQVKELLPDGTLVPDGGDGDTVPDGLHAAGEGITASSVAGIALDQSLTRMYLTSTQTRHWVLVLDDDGGIQPADSTILPATDVEAHSATVNATVNPNGFSTTYRFEYSQDGVGWTPLGSFQSAGNGTSDVPVSAPVEGLEANSLYRVRIVVQTLFAGNSTSPELTFATDVVPPDVTTGAAQRVTSGSAEVRGLINPNNLPTTYWVEYGKTTSYGSRAPVPDGSAGSEGLEELFVVELEGLDAAKTYHYRFVASNSKGTSFGANRELTTRAATSPGGDRAYEMVTPPDKAGRLGGGQELADDARVAIPSPDGESVLFSISYVLLDADAGSGIPQFSNASLIERSPGGWQGEAVVDIPSHDPVVGGLGTAVGISSDLTAQAWELDEALFDNGSPLGVRLFGDTGGYNGSGWYNWLTEDSLVPGVTGEDRALLTDNGAQLLRWDRAYRGLLEDPDTVGTEDPSVNQLPGGEGGAALYKQEGAGDGPRHLVNECSGSGAGATLVPMVDDKGNNNLPLSAGNVTTTAGSPTVTVDSLLTPDPFAVGQLVDETVDTGAQFPAGTSIVGVSGNTLTLSAPAAGSTSGGVLVANANPNDDEVAGQECAEGSVTSARGAIAGGGAFTGTFGGVLRTSMSVDGDRVFFTSPDPAADGVPSTCGSTAGPATSCPPQLFVRQYDSDGDATVRWISRSRSVAEGDNRYGGGIVDGQHPSLFSGAAFEGASSDGQAVYFRTNQPLTPDDPNATGTPGPKLAGTPSNSSWDLYRYELPGDTETDPGGGTLTRVSGGPDDGDGDADPGDFDPNVVDPAAGVSMRFLSEDGQKAYFVTRGAIGSLGDSWNDAPEGGATTPSGTAGTTATRNLYLYDAAESGNDRWRFVAQLPYSGAGASVDACASSSAGSGMPAGFEDGTRARNVNCVHGLPSGDVIAFETTGQLTDDDEDTASDIYLYDAAADQLTRVTAPSDGDTGYVCDNTVSPESLCNGTMGEDPTWTFYEQVGLSGAQSQNFAVYDGELSFFFESRVPFADEDDNGTGMDVYEWRNGELSLVSPGTDGDEGFFSGNTLDGEDVFFATAGRIDPREIDADFDIYDARIGGGIPLPPSPTPCDALAGGCQAGSGGGAVQGPTTSDEPGGGGNVVPGDRVSLSLARPGSRAQRRAIRSGVLAVRITASGPGVARVSAKGSIGGKLRSVGTARKRIAKAGVATLRLRLSSQARAHLRRTGSLRLTLTARMPNARPRSVTLRIKGGNR